MQAAQLSKLAPWPGFPRLSRKRFFARAAAAAISPWLAGAAAADPARTLCLSYEFPQPSIQLHEAKARVTVSGCETFERAGEPALPFRTARVLLPAGFTVEKVAVQSPQSPKVLPGAWELERGHRLVSARKTNASPPPSSIRPADAESLSLSATVPVQQVQLLDVQRLLGFDIALIRLFPVDYRPTNGQLRFSSRLDVTLTLVPSAAKGVMPYPARGQASARATGCLLG